MHEAERDLLQKKWFCDTGLRVYLYLLVVAAYKVLENSCSQPAEVRHSFLYTKRYDGI